MRAHLLILTLLLLVPASAAAQCPLPIQVQQQFDRAQQLYIIRAFDKVRPILEPLLVKQCFNDRDLQRLARIFLAVAFLDGEQHPLAEKYILDMLLSDPDVQINPAIAPPSALRFIEDVRTRHAGELDRVRVLQGSSEDVLVDGFWVLIEVQRNQYWINFLPFGAGAFQSGDVGWGAFFASAQLTTLGMSLGGWIAVEALRGSTAQFTPQEADAARDAQVVQLVGAGAFAVFYAWSVIDALVKHKDEVRTTLPPTDAYPEDALKEATGEVSWRLFPIIDAEHGGVGFQITY